MEISKLGKEERLNREISFSHLHLDGIGQTVRHNTEPSGELPLRALADEYISTAKQRAKLADRVGKKVGTELLLSG